MKRRLPSHDPLANFAWHLASAGLKMNILAESYFKIFLIDSLALRAKKKKNEPIFAMEGVDTAENGPSSV